MLQKQYVTKESAAKGSVSTGGTTIGQAIHRLVSEKRHLQISSPCTMFKIGPWVIKQPTILAPMAGVTDVPFRKLCRSLGAGLTVSEMLTSDSRLWNSRKSKLRLTKSNDAGPQSIQLAGNDPEVMAEAAKANANMGAQIIDINMGCPAKKVCKKAAGSALLRDEQLVSDILNAVVSAVDIPVTLKIRTGWDTEHRNGITIAKIAEDSGISALAVHGRTRACAFKGKAEYDTIAKIVSSVSIPVFANGDINTPEQAQEVLSFTGATAIMIGRGAFGNPWLFREINHFVATGSKLASPSLEELSDTMLIHLQDLYSFYGEVMGTKIARKHMSWYLDNPTLLSTNKFCPQQLLSETNCSLMSDQGNQLEQYRSSLKKELRKNFNRIDSAKEQQRFIQSFFNTLETIEEKAA